MSSFDITRLEILEQIAAGDDLSPVLDRIVRMVEQESADMACSILLLDGEQGTLRHGAAPSLPRAYADAIDGTVIGLESGSCGTAAFTGEVVIVEDIATHPAWARFKHLALPHGLLACWSSPIFAPNRQVLGTFAMYYRETRGPSHREARLVEAATHLAAIAIGRGRDELERRRLIHILNERVKELTVLHGAARLLQAERPMTKEFLSDLARLLPQGWQHGDVCEARVVCGSLEATTEGWREAEWKQSAAFSGGGQQGVVEVAYVEPRPTAAEGPFLKEERALLESLAEMLSSHLDHRWAVAALKQSETQLRVLFEQAGIGMALVDPDGRPIKCNPAFERFLGYNAAELAEMRIAEFTLPDYAATDAEFYLSLLTGERDTYEIEKQYLRKDGTVVCGRLTVSAVRGPDRRLHYAIGMVQDITAYKKSEADRAILEAQLRHAQRLQSLGTLTGGIAHDFNNILSAIRGNTKVAEGELPSGHPARERLVEIERAAARAADLVRQILTFSRREPPKREVIQLQPVVEDAVKLLRASLTPKVEIHTDLDPDTAHVSADSGQIHQVMMNLGTNAAHATGDSAGVVEIRLECVEVDAELKRQSPDLALGPYVRLSVVDHGCGMDKATQERIFEPFFTTKAAGKGTGLGLSVVHGIVKSHDGALVVSSRPGAGSSFQVYLPAIEQHCGGAQAPTDRTPEARGEHILYLDDEESLVYLSGRLLESFGYRVSGFTDPVHALQAFRLRPMDYDAVVSVIAMPGMSGVEFAREVLRGRPGVPLVLISGYFKPEDVQAARELGVTELVLKPNSVEGLARVLHRVLSGR